ncbi:MAG TPA: hypothetical protein V6D08_06775 [Candidatus Obscuribacterales bacterium]
MGRIVWLLPVLLLVWLPGRGALGQESLRIPRTAKPLSGKVDFNVLAPGREPLSGGAEAGRLQGAVDTQALGAGAAAAGLAGGAGVARLDTAAPFQLGAARNTFWGEVSERELALLSAHDVVVILDRSSSMKTRDCFAAMPGERAWSPARDPPGSRQLRLLSRWQWCVEQALDLAGQKARVPGRAVTLVLFARDYDVYENVSLGQLPRIFSNAGLGKGTYMAAPLDRQLSEFFRRRQAGYDRPLAVAVITDGVPDDSEALLGTIIDATRNLKSPRELSITFLHVGTDLRGQQLLDMLDHGLVARGARYDIVHTRAFSELLEKGLTRVLIESIAARP